MSNIIVSITDHSYLLCLGITLENRHQSLLYKVYGDKSDDTALLSEHMIISYLRPASEVRSTCTCTLMSICCSYMADGGSSFKLAYYNGKRHAVHMGYVLQKADFMISYKFMYIIIGKSRSERVTIVCLPSCPYDFYPTCIRTWQSNTCRFVCLLLLSSLVRKSRHLSTS